MPKTTRRFVAAAASLSALLLAHSTLAFHGGHTGVTEAQLKAACPAFSAGAIELADSIAPPGNLPMTDIFEHETGARCSCTRTRTEKHSLKCGPTGLTPRRG